MLLVDPLQVADLAADGHEDLAEVVLSFASADSPDTDLWGREPNGSTQDS